jgi:hypothetical protein
MAERQRTNHRTLTLCCAPVSNEEVYEKEEGRGQGQEQISESPP